MGPFARFAAAPLLLAVAAGCADGRSETLVDASLERDLKLASAGSFAMAPAATDSLMLLDAAPPAAVTPAPKPRAATSGSRRVNSPRPTIASAPAPEPAVSDAAAVLETITQPSGEAIAAVSTDEMAAAEGEVVADAGVALPRPVPATVPAPGSGTGDYDRGRDDSGGGWGGVIIRGGDIDDCRVDRPQGRRRPARRGGGLGDRWPHPGGVAQGGSRGGGTWPTTRRTGSGGGRSSGGSSGPVWRRGQ